MSNVIFRVYTAILFFFCASPGFGQGTAFTYQGNLNESGAPANGSYDVQFALFDASAGGIAIAGPVTNTAVAVSNGLFTTTVDFGNAFTGASNWLQIAVSTNAANAFTTLAPRQFLTAAPYAVTARNITGTVNASQLSGSIPAANISGTIPLAQLPTTVITNGATNVNITGTFTGNGAGVTGVSLYSLAANPVISWGTFVQSSLAVGTNPAAVIAVDVNGDGRIDLVSANNGGNTLSVLTNNGNGGFALSSSPAVGAGPTALVSADVNEDGKADLVSANLGANTLSVLTNNGSGGFALYASPGTGSGPFSVAAGDVNGDGRVDLIAVNFNSDTLSVLINNGNGGFVLSASPAVGDGPRSVTVGDFNGDGHIDLICANFLSGTISVLINNGSGGFNPAVSYGAGDSPISITAAELNGDGRVDLAIANYGSFGNPGVTVLTNIGAGNFGFSWGMGGVAIWFPVCLVAGDVDADGVLDLIISSVQITGVGANTVSVLKNNGSATFNLLTSMPAGNRPENMTAADLNGDSYLDLISVISGNNTLAIYANTPSFTGTLFASPPYLKFAEITANVPAGASVAGTNNWRKFNALLTDTHNLGSTSAGDMILPAGTYQCRISAPGFRVQTHQIRLRTSTGTNLLFGTTGYADESSGGSEDRTQIDGQFTLAATTTLRVQQWCTLAAGSGLGSLSPFNWGDSNQTIFAVAEFWKIK